MCRGVFALVFLLALAAGHGSRAQDSSVLIRLRNSCSFSVWAAWTTDPGVSNPFSSGTELSADETFSLFVPRDWSGRFWGRTGCSWRQAPGSSTSKFICDTGDCGSGDISCSKRGTPPATIAQLNLPARYSVSLLEGYNLAISIAPRNSSCSWAGCKSGSDANSGCPKELAVVDKSNIGRVIACKSPCLGLNEDQYCCRGRYTCPLKCSPSQYARAFKDACPRSSTYPCEANTSSYSCLGASEIIATFCPP
ncbi:thaumatin-like protein 1 [Selaginella moellendorffii]|uniref:thaumatin-like protein 1 n=1 Tax=Selaginella moellendorffii TaxID=88036 RepID=UPI000D1CEA90|nr:thaumatin-like protein 1 [Selaginella moellendorffii]|eukprot:XP_024539716.1 thaumatin-like protein 1 [Selaginella moellendorffii]